MTARAFLASRDSVGAARRFAADQMPDVTVDLHDAVLLMVSELATNAVVHAASAFDVSIDRAGTLVRVSVTDQGGGVPAMQSPDASEPHGRGLRIVETLSDRWGTSATTGGGTVVWFEIDVAPGDGDDRSYRVGRDHLDSSDRNEGSHDDVPTGSSDRVSNSATVPGKRWRPAARHDQAAPLASSAA